MNLVVRLGCAFVLVAGCGKDKTANEQPGSAAAPATASAPAAPKPLDGEWNEKYGSYELSLKGGHGKGSVSAIKDSVYLRLEELTVGDRYELGDTKGKYDDQYGKSVEIPIREKLGDIAWDDLKKVDTGLTLKLQLVDGRQGELKIPPLGFDFVIGDVFKKIENGPVMFGTEADDPKPADSMLLAGMHPEIIGRAGKLREIDFVATYALDTSADKGRKTCKGYKDKDDKPMADLTLVLRETEATIWNRRTGEVVEKKRFAPDAECPMFTMQKEGETDHDSYPPEDKIKDWLKTKIKR